MGEAMKGTVTADISNFQAGILKAKGLAKTFGVSVESSLGVGQFKGMVAGALSIGAVTAGVQALLNKADGIDALAKRFDISAEAIQSIQFAADQSGASSEAMFMGLKKLSVAIEEARGGNKEYIESLVGLGVSLDDIKTKGAEALFYQIGNRINGTGKEATKLTDGIKVFGRAGDVVLGAMRDGFTEVANGAKAAGVVIENDLVKKLADAHDQMAKLTGQMTKLFALTLGFAMQSTENLGTTLGAAYALTFDGVTKADLIGPRKRGQMADREDMRASFSGRAAGGGVAIQAASEFRGASFQAPNLSGNQSVGAFSGQNPFLERQIAIERQMLELQTKMEEHARKTAEATTKTANKPPDGTMD